MAITSCHERKMDEIIREKEESTTSEIKNILNEHYKYVPHKSEITRWYKSRDDTEVEVDGWSDYRRVVIKLKKEDKGK